MSIPQPLEIALFLVLLAVLVVFRVTNVQRFAFMTGFLVPLITPRLYLGVGLDFYKVLGFVVLALLIGRRAPAASATRNMLLLILYAAVVTGVWATLEYTTLHRYRAAEAFGLEVTSTYYKMPVQFLSFVGQLLLALTIPKLAATEVEAQKSIDGFAAGCITSTVVGLLLWITTGNGVVSSHLAIIETEGVRFARLGGLSGEPKTLGAVLTILSLYFLCDIVFNKSESGRRSWLLGAALLGLGMTFATSAWVGFALGLGVLFVVALVRGRWTRFAGFGAGFLVLATLVMTNPVSRTLFDLRFGKRLYGTSSEVSRQKDSYVFQAFEDSPRDAVWGYGLGGSDLEVTRYVPPAERWYRRSPTPGVTGVRIVGDLGVLGVLCFAGIALFWSRRSFRLGDRAGGAFMLVGFVAMMFMSQNGLSAYLLLAGALAARAALRSSVRVPGDAVVSPASTRALRLV